VNRFFKRSALRLEDWARSHHLSVIANGARTALAWFGGARKFADSAGKFLGAGAPRRASMPVVKRALRRLAAEPRALAGERVKLTRAVVAKAPVSAEERGILFVSFENELARVLESGRADALQERYLIAFLPTWQPAYSGELLELAALARAPFVVMPSSVEDVALLPGELGPHCMTVDLQASSWIPSAQFAPVANKDVDIVLLANFSKYKRHWKLFEALRDMRRECRVVCAGRPWGGRQRASLEAEADAFGVRHLVEFFENPSDAQVSDLLGRARLFCAMSHKEGSFVAVAEALVAGTPVAMFADATIGTKRFITRDTGFLLSRGNLGAQLNAALEQAASLRPREWACREIVAERSIEVFNEAMRRQHAQRRLPWTRDCAGVYSRNFAFGYLQLADEALMAACYAELASDFGIDIALLPATR
jgi:glycosyltransferase involved in cell wall biosynthesis